MHAREWLNTDDRFIAGAELFRSDRAFTVWAYTISHSQLLLRTRTRIGQSRIDIVFKPVLAVKLRIEYRDGLVIRCAHQTEAEQIRAENTDLDPSDGARYLILETGEDRDYVVTYAVGWEEDTATDSDPSKLADFVPGTDPARILP
ncbi:hypothetical protein GCM10023196_093210 [Actinoallomurus vinaceus]|uniref:Uncharacterized protein n=1 Tax=Actinoallomurus vinaceus TaxID=1080074 RepID=A0ABP8USV0_9ACTN